MISSFIDHEDFFHHFQPIYDLKEGYIVGYEVLLRSKKFANPELAFNSAIKEKKLYELDSRSIHKALKTYHSAGFTRKEGILFVNVFPSTLLNPKFPSFISVIMKEKLLSNQEIVFEISEKETNYDLNRLKKVLKQLKKVGISYAIDDYGISNGDMERLIELDPYYLKLDQFFSRDLHKSPKKQEMIKNVLEYCNKFDTILVLEGLENALDVSFSKSLGVPLGQGYKLGVPNLLKGLG